MTNTAYCFDLDGTVTRDELLPIIASEVGLSEEIGFLTRLTIQGQIPFEMSFRLRCRLLSDIPIKTVAEIVDQVPLDETIVDFIKSSQESCYIVTGNLDVWIEKIITKLGCGFFSSEATRRADGKLGPLTKILRKSDAIRELRPKYDRLVSIGEGANDLPMFQEADVRIAYGGVHAPAQGLVEVSDYVVSNGSALCRLLKTL
jgi:HAD superfamily phosphoserine phosphatase-like hydrolase